MFLRNKRGVSPKFGIILGLIAVLVLSSFIVFSPFGGNVQYALSQPPSEQENYIEIMHSPYEIEEGETITFTATAYSIDKIEEIQIYVENNLVKSCTFGIGDDPNNNSNENEDRGGKIGEDIENCIFSASYNGGSFSYYANFYSNVSQTCENGECMCEEYEKTNCVLDSDGEDTLTSGLISFESPNGEGMSKNDYCIDEVFLFEYYCSDLLIDNEGGERDNDEEGTDLQGFVGGKVYFCNFGCSNGACVDDPQRIDPWISEGYCEQDSDSGVIPYAFGETGTLFGGPNDLQIRLSDSCFNENILMEYYCDETIIFGELYFCNDEWYSSEIGNFVVKSSSWEGEGSSNDDCVENWQCSSWSACINDQQTRTCIDLNDCGTEIYVPLFSQSCMPGSGNNMDEQEESFIPQLLKELKEKPLYIFFIIIGIIIVGGIITIILINNKKKKY